MNINLKQLWAVEELALDEDILFAKTFQNSNIRHVKNTNFKGRIYINSADEVILEGNLSGKITLIDAMTLADIEKDIIVEIDELLIENANNFNFQQNMLDISEVLWQNIVLEVPISITKNEKPEITSGEGWELKNENEKRIDPRLAPLQELLDEGKE